MLVTIAVLHLQVSPASAQNGASLPVANGNITVTANFTPGEWIERTRVIELTLDPTPAYLPGRLAVVIGTTDFTQLFEVTESGLRFRPEIVPLPRGEQTMTVYLVTSPQTSQVIAEIPLRVLAAGGFEQIAATPALSVNSTGQIAQGRLPAQPPADRDTFQDVSVTAGIQTTLRRGGWTTLMHANVVGVSNRAQALRFALRGDAAPPVDLADYSLALQHAQATIGLGHLSTGASRHLINGFASRGLQASYKPTSAVDVSFAAINGSSVVGFSNLLGVQQSGHRIVVATVGAELLPARPGGARLALTILNGSLRPLTGFNDAFVNDAESSRGTSVNFAGTDAQQRVRLDAGYTRSRFENPVDPLLAQDVSLLSVDRTTRSARHLDASVVVIQDAALSSRYRANVMATFRHERIDPLFRSVAAPLQADVESNGVEVAASVGPVMSQFGQTWTHDNLAALPSILTTRTRNSVWTTTIPIDQLRAGDAGPDSRLPSITYALNRVHQFGDGLPIDADFDALSQVPDQVSLNHSIGAMWQATDWRAGYRYNRSFQDNRQPGRELADLLNFTHAISAGATFTQRADVGAEFAWEGADNREFDEVNGTRRLSVTASAQPARRTAVSGTVTWTFAANEAATREQRSTDLTLQISQTIVLAPRRPEALQGQLFVRVARQAQLSFDQIFAIAPSVQRQWTVSTGLTFRVF